MNQIITVTGLTNLEFLEKYAAAGRVGLAGGRTLVDKAIGRAQRHLDTDKAWGRWSHAFLFQGLRHDKHHWVIESDMQIHRRHIQLGVQENRAAKFHDESLYSPLAVLDFALSEDQIASMLAHALELVAARTRYSLRELVGTLFALRHPSFRGRTNLLARPQSYYCSAFVHHLLRGSGLDLVPGLNEKNTTPEDLWRTLALHTAYVLERPMPPGKRTRVINRVRKLRRGKSVAERKS